MSQGTLEQQRADHAYKAAQAVVKEEWSKDYRSYTSRLGPTVLMSGLGNALALEKAGSGGEKKAHHKLFDNLSSWLSRSGGPYESKTDVLEALFTGSQEKYLLAQADALKWIEWHKKFCAALLPRREDESE